MDYISKEEWYELSKWLDISHGFYEAYTRFCIKGKEIHRLKFNKRNIEVGFSYSKAYPDMVEVKIYRPDVEMELCKSFFFEKKGCYIKKRTAKKIIAEIHRLAWDSFLPEVSNITTYNITTYNSEKTYQQIKKILKDMDNQITDYYDENYFTMDAGVDLECIIEIYNRQIKVTARFNDIAWRTVFLLECITTGRNSGIYDTYNTTCLEDVARRIQYLALEPECFKITTTDSEWESELIRTIVVEAIAACSTEEERIIELHNKQIIIQLQDNGQSLDVFLDCVTTGRSSSCVVECYEKNPEELICKIQELAWEDV